MRIMFILTSISILLIGCSGDRPHPLRRADSSAVAPPTNVSTPMRATRMTIPAFSGTRAYAQLTKQTSFGPRNPNSAGHRACLQYLISTLQGFADRVELQEFMHDGYGGEKLRLTNLIAAFKPQVSTRILLCAHWDTRPRAEHDTNKSRRNEPILGANDGASGVAVLLEIAGFLKSNPPMVGVDVVLFDGEDYGMEGDRESYLLGSKYFAEHKQADYVPKFGILLDMVGDKELEIPKEQNSVRFAPDVVQLIWSTSRDLGITQFVDQAGEEVLDDHWPLNSAGIKTVDLIDFDYPDRTNRFWHTHKDIPENCSAESLEAVGTVVTQIVYTQTP
jgi:glutaminyl-peptide cyclotransferase